MAKKFPRFLFSDPTNVKTKGPFIVHTLEPHFICKPIFDNKRNLIDLTAIEMFNEKDNALKHVKAHSVFDEMKEWYKYSGIHQSSNADDRIVSEVSKCEFLKDYTKHYTVEEARTVIKLLFPTKAKKIYEGSSTYGIKHLLEHVSQTVINSGHRTNKYCGNNTVIEVFKTEGFKMVADGPNFHMNLLASEVNRAYRLFWNY